MRSQLAHPTGLVAVCDRCAPDQTGRVVRALRRRLTELIGRRSPIVTSTGCLRTCPQDGVAVISATPRECREWAVPAQSDADLDISEIAHSTATSVHAATKPILAKETESGLFLQVRMR